MTIVELVFLLVLIGVGLYLLNTYVPMAAPIKSIINVVVVLLVVLWLAELFGLFQLGGTIGPRHRL
jgi:hypothetical protein